MIARNWGDQPAPDPRSGVMGPCASAGRETDTFSSVVAGCTPALRRVAERVLGCPHLADDAVQEALIALWRERNRPRSPLAWLSRAVLHRSLHLRRTRSRRKRHEEAFCERCRERHASVGAPELLANAELRAATPDGAEAELREVVSMARADDKLAELRAELGLDEEESSPTPELEA